MYSRLIGLLLVVLLFSFSITYYGIAPLSARAAVVGALAAVGFAR